MTINDVLEKYQKMQIFEGIKLTSPNQSGIGQDTPLHVACQKGRIDDVRTMLQAGGDPNLPGDLGRTALHFAAAWGHVEIVKLLLESGASPTLKDEEGYGAADVAELSDQGEIASILKQWKSR